MNWGAYWTIGRYMFPILGLWILLRCGTDLLKCRKKQGRNITTLLLVTLFQCWICFGFLLHGMDGYEVAAVLSFGGLAIMEWSMLLSYSLADKPGFALESLLFFLCSIGMGAVASVNPEEIVKQLVAIGLGIMAYGVIGWLLLREYAVKTVGYGASAVGLALMVITVLFGKEYYGAKNWLVIGPISVQPSEISKICFVYAGAAFLKRKGCGTAVLILYTALICLCLMWMNDFGGVMLFFAAFVVMVLLRTGVMGALICSVLGGWLAWWRMPPHALGRIAVWRHIWEQPLAGGYQQTRALMCIASGGLFGLGIGAGKIGSLFAADSDLIIAVICETWGILAGSMIVAALGIVLWFTVKRACFVGEFRALTGCAAATMLAIQGMLNLLGTVDMLPMTGVTLPFVSNGGTGMMAAWGLAAFVKTMEEREI